jgi:hypothetical protein
MKKSIIPSIKIAAVILVGTLALTACHATPSTPPVTNKNNGVLESRLAQTAPAGKYAAPQTWKATYAHGKLTVDIDATVETPDVTQYPVYQIAPLDVSQSLTDKLVKVLMQGKTIYPIRDMDKDMTKAEILQKIADLKAGKNSDMHTTDPAAYAKFIQPQVEQLEARLATALDTIERKPSNGKLGSLDVVPASSLLSRDSSSSETSSNDGLQKYTGLFAEADLGQPNLATLRIQKSADDKDESVRFDNGTNLLAINTVFSKLPTLTISADQGSEIAKKAIAGLGLTNMKIVATDTSKAYYVYHFIQTVQGISMNFTEPSLDQLGVGGASGSSSSSESDLQDAQYSEPWGEESLFVYVNNNGIAELLWVNPEKVGKTVTQNVALLTFDQIEQKFANAMEYEGVFSNDVLLEHRTIHVTKISLGLARIPQKGHVGSYFLVPAWDLYGTMTDKETDKDQDPSLNSNHEYVRNTLNTSYATINAIDGTIIDRSWSASPAATTNYVADNK